jgi:glutaredoxin
MSDCEATLYTRAGCCLCNTAKALLEKHGLTVKEIDIDEDARLREQYTDCVPVVFLQGRERFRGRIDERLLVRILRQES